MLAELGLSRSIWPSCPLLLCMKPKLIGYSWFWLFLAFLLSLSLSMITPCQCHYSDLGGCLCLFAPCSISSNCLLPLLTLLSWPPNLPAARAEVVDGVVPALKASVHSVLTVTNLATPKTTVMTSTAVFGLLMLSKLLLIHLLFLLPLSASHLSLSP